MQLSETIAGVSWQHGAAEKLRQIAAKSRNHVLVLIRISASLQQSEPHRPGIEKDGPMKLIADWLVRAW